MLVLAYPMVISQGAFALMIFTDRFFMSMLSPTHMAASLGGGVASFFCMSLFIGILSYTNALSAQYFGQGQKEKCPRVVTQGLFQLIVFAPLLIAIGYITVNLFSFMGHAPEQVELEVSYFLILIWGASAALLKICLASYFAGIGRTHIVMIADTIGVAINIPLSYALIFGFGDIPALGIEGAAYGTIISTILSVLIFCYFYFERKHSQEFSVAQSFRWDAGIQNRFVRLGYPSGIEMFLNVAAFNLFLLMFQSYGIAESASAAIVFNWDIVSFVPMMGLNTAIISLVGRSIGAGDTSQLYEVIKIGFVIGLGFSSVLAVTFFVFRDPLVAVFLSDDTPDYFLNLAGFMMIGLSSYVMADAIILIAGGVLRGAGDTRWLMWMSIAIHWAMLIIEYFVIKVWELGPRVAWVVFVVMILSTGAIYIGRLFSPAWRTEEAFERVMAEQY